MSKQLPASLRLRLERVRRHLTQRQLAETIGCSCDWLQQLEKDNSARPSVALAERIHKAVGVPPAAWGELRHRRVR